MRELKGVSRNQYNHGYVELMEKFRILDQRISSKADDVVLTMALAHRKEIENINQEIIQVKKELNQLRQENEKQTITTTIKKQKRKNWFKLLPFNTH